MAIKALIFDFDGLILDTEVPEYEAWRAVYEDHGCRLDFEEWAQCIGRGSRFFNPYDVLEAQFGKPIEREAVRAVKRSRFQELLAEESLQPGVQEYINDAKLLGLKIGIASSSHSEWVLGHIERFGIHVHFDTIKCADDVAHTKPDPELYHAALQALGVKPNEAIALEDSPNGVLSAKSAGIYCVAVPNRITSRLDLSHADLKLGSLNDLSLEELIGVVTKKQDTI
jgi:HAD superfamily hydrolase (TIGR01509 family)